MKTCIIYYSLDGNTKAAATNISKALDADLIEIQPCKEYPSKRAFLMFIGGYQSTFGREIPLKTIEQDLEQYDKIILGTPVWAGKPAAPVQQFLKENQIEGKVAGVFTCSGGGKNEGCIDFIESLGCNPRAVVSLADRKSDLASENEKKLQEFIESVIDI